MSRFIYQGKIIKTPTVPWAEDYFVSQNQMEKQQRLLEVYRQRNLMLNVNQSFQSWQTDTEKHLYVNMDRAEYRKFNTDVDALSASGGKDYELLIDEVFEYMRSTGMYFWSGWKEVTETGEIYQLTLDSSDPEIQQNFFQTLVVRPL